MEKWKIYWNVHPQMEAVLAVVEEEVANCLSHILMEIIIEIFHLVG